MMVMVVNAAAVVMRVITDRKEIKRGIQKDAVVLQYEQRMVSPRLTVSGMCVNRICKAPTPNEGYHQSPNEFAKCVVGK